MTSVLAQSLVWISLIVFMISSIIIISKKRYGFIGLGFCVYWILFFLFPATFHLQTGYFPFYGMFYEVEYQNMAAIATIIFCLFFFFGFFFKKTNQTVLLERTAQKFEIEIRVDKVFLFVSASVLFQAFSILYFGMPAFLSQRNEINFDNFGGGAGSVALLSFIRTLSFITLLGVCFLTYKKINFIKYWCSVLIVLSVFFVINYPLALPRYIFFSYVLSFIYVLVDCRVRAKLFIFICFALGVTTIFPAFSVLTRGNGDIRSINFTDYYSSSGDFDGFQSLINTMIYVVDWGVSFGYQALGVILVFVPRVLWMNKPIPTGTLVADNAGYAFTNISSPIISEIFIDFGWFGLPVFSFFLGVLIRSLDIYSIRSKNEGDWVGVFVSAAIFSTIIIVMRGSLMGVISNVILFIGMAWLAAKLTVERRKG